MPAEILTVPRVQGVKGDEARAVEAFCRYLTALGWQVEREVAQCDVVAKRGPETLYAEAKGRTTETGLDLDTMFGQLLRRMKQDPQLGDRYAVVVPLEAAAAVARVPSRVRELLHISTYVVAPDNVVSEQ